MKRIALVGCGKSKLDHAAEAQDLYTGPLFQKAKAFAQVDADAWYILSARHCTVRPTKVLEPYEYRLDSKTQQERYLWGVVARNDLSRYLVDDGHMRLVKSPTGFLIFPPDEPVTLVMLAGQAYVDPLVAQLAGKPFHIEEPMKGMGIGDRLKWLGNAAQTDLFTRSRRVV